jgi:hypothetical protein
VLQRTGGQITGAPPCAGRCDAGGALASSTAVLLLPNCRLAGNGETP